MKRSIEDQIKLTALKQTAPPPPTLLEKPKSVQEDLVGGGSSNMFCGVTIPPRVIDFMARINMRYHSVVQDTYEELIGWMYCRPHPIPGGGCERLYLGPPLGEQPRVAGDWYYIVTDRDKPLTWQRSHPEFNPDDPATWGSVFGPGGFVEERITYHFSYADENGQYGRGPLFPGVTQADIDAMVDFIRQLYAARCGFIVAQTGSCCVFDDDFGGAQCSETTSYSCPGIYTPGGNCNGPNPCGLASNQLQQNDQAKKQTPIMDMVMSALKGK